MNYKRANDFEKFFIAHLPRQMKERCILLGLNGASRYDIKLFSSDGNSNCYFDVKQHACVYDRQPGWIKIAKDVSGNGNWKYVDALQDSEGDDANDYFLVIIEPINIYIIDAKKLWTAIKNNELQIKTGITDDKELNREVQTLSVKMNNYDDSRFCKYIIKTDKSLFSSDSEKTLEYFKWWISSPEERLKQEREIARLALLKLKKDNHK